MKYNKKIFFHVIRMDNKKSYYENKQTKKYARNHYHLTYSKVIAKKLE